MNPRTLADNGSQRALLLEHLELTRDQLAVGEQHIAQQKQLIVELGPHGTAIFWAREFLGALEHMQTKHAAHRDRLERELATANPE